VKTVQNPVVKDKEFLKLSSREMARYKDKQVLFLAGLAGWFGNLGMHGVRCTLSGIAEHRETGLCEGLETPHLVFGFSIPGSRSGGYLLADCGTSSMLLAAILGEDERWAGTACEPDHLEVQLLEEGICDVLQLWKDAWGLDDNMCGKPRHSAIPAPGEYLRWQCRISQRGVDGAFAVALPLETAAGLAPTPQPVAGDLAVSLIPFPLRSEEVEVAVEVSPATLTLGGLWSLSPGDVMELERRSGDELVLLVGSRPLFLGRLVQRAGTPGFLVTSLFDEDKENPNG